MKKIFFTGLFITLVLAIFTNCDDNNDLFLKEKVVLESYLIKNNIDADTIKDGLYYIKGRTGIGKLPIKGSKITLIYTGFLINGQSYQDGKIFDMTTLNAPYSFSFNSGQVIKGWDLGLANMREGDTGRLIIRSDYAYGELKVGTIPAYSTLIFDIFVVKVE